MDVFLGVGSNVGDRRANIAKAIDYLKNTDSLTVEKESCLIETDPQGGPPQGKFLNCVIKIKTKIAPKELLSILKDIENKLGRIRTVKNGPRVIDLDILLYGDKRIDEPNLKIPHPRMLEREFVMKPLLEIEPEIAEKLKTLNHNDCCQKY